jgi:hypothetical protein
MMEDSLGSTHSPLLMKIVAPIVAAVAIAAAGIGYAVHEHSAAQNMTDQNSQMTAQLNSTHMQLEALTAHVNSLEASNQTKPPESAPVERAGGRRPSEHRAARPDPRFGKLQSQLDAQGKRIDAEDQQIADARTDLTGSIAKTHDELVVLEKKGERNYFEFDIQKSKEFKHEGPVGISLRKANAKRGYADLMLMVDDRNLQTKHVNLFQPSMFYESDSPQPIEIVINDVSKDHIHGYVSAPKYRKSELDAMASANANAANGNQQAANSTNGDNGIVGQPASGPDQATSADTQPATRQRLPLPSSQPNQQ